MRKKPFIPGVLLAGGVIVLVALAAYGNSFSGPFIFDDSSAIIENPTIRHLWPIAEVLSPPPGMTVSGRPVFNLSLAVNYALGGAGVRGYHVLNLGIHIFAGLTLLGIVRRTLLRPVLRERFGEAALPLALAVALLWTVHPLQTEAVTYVVQRTESLMGLFYLLTMYCFIRGAESPAPQQSRGWHWLSVMACLLGMATKEVMVSAPLMVLLYDRTFVAGTFREAWRRRAWFYAGLAGTWLLLGWLVGALMVNGGGNRDATSGFHVGVAWWTYVQTQFPAMVRYIWLSVWPHPLVLDYGAEWIRRAAEFVPQALIVFLLAAGTVVGWWRRPVLSFAGVWFFAILAPTSLVPGTSQTLAEHRMYLPLAAVLALAVPALHALIGRRSFLIFLLLAAALVVLTWQRNGNYRSDAAIWRDTVAKRPGNARAHNNLGHALFQAGRMAEAVGHYEQASRLRPDFAAAHYNLGEALARMNRVAEAISHYEEALRLNPGYASAHNNLGLLLFQTGRTGEAIGHYEEALRLQPDSADAHHVHYNLGNALLDVGRGEEAVGHYGEALRLQPGYGEAHNNLGNALVQMGRAAEAMKHFEEASRLQPDSASARYNLGNVLTGMNRLPEAIEQYRQALRIRPDYVQAHLNLGTALMQTGREAEAVGHYEEALRLKPNFDGACYIHYNLGNALVQAGRGAEAVEHYQEALRLKPDFAAARDYLARLRSNQ